MNTSVTPISAVSSSTTAQALIALQEQMQAYAKAASAMSMQAATDYRTLQTAVSSGNVSEALAALTRLQAQEKADSAAALKSPIANPASATPLDSDGDHDGAIKIDVKA